MPSGDPMEFVWIPPGSFVMGSTHGEAYERRALGLWENSFGNEQPALEQTIGEGFYLGKYEITQRQWTAAMGTRPWGAYVSGQHNAAAVCLSWDVVQAFVANSPRPWAIRFIASRPRPSGNTRRGPARLRHGFSALILPCSATTPGVRATPGPKARGRRCRWG